MPNLDTKPFTSKDLLKVDLKMKFKNGPFLLFRNGLFFCVLSWLLSSSFRPVNHEFNSIPIDTSLKAQITFEEEVHDFGVMREGTIASYDFLFTNQGKAPLIILGVSASCGCTTPYYSKDPILPGKTGLITITFNSTNRTGTFSKAIRVKTNSQNQENILIIRGLVEPKSQKAPSPIMNN